MARNGVPAGLSKCLALREIMCSMVVDYEMKYECHGIKYRCTDSVQRNAGIGVHGIIGQTQVCGAN